MPSKISFPLSWEKEIEMPRNEKQPKERERSFYISDKHAHIKRVLFSLSGNHENLWTKVERSKKFLEGATLFPIPDPKGLKLPDNKTLLLFLPRSSKIEDLEGLLDEKGVKEVILTHYCGSTVLEKADGKVSRRFASEEERKLAIMFYVSCPVYFKKLHPHIANGNDLMVMIVWYRKHTKGLNASFVEQQLLNKK